MGLDMYLIKGKKRGQQDEDGSNIVVYWRKANQIHKWFVDNIQCGEDDCGYYEVTEEDLRTLLLVCEEVMRVADIKSGLITNGYKYKNGQKLPIYEQGKYISNEEEVENLLPTTSGFFFGNTAYDEYYIQDVEFTIRVIRKLLNTFNFNEYYLKYTSSW